MLLYGRGQPVMPSPAVVALGTMSMMATLIAMAIFFSSWKLSRRWSERAAAYRSIHRVRPAMLLQG